MSTHADKKTSNKNRSETNLAAQEQVNVMQGIGFVDNRAEVKRQQNLQLMMQQSHNQAHTWSHLKGSLGKSQFQGGSGPTRQLTNISAKGVVQKRQHGNLDITNFLQQNTQNDGEERGDYVGRVTALFK